MQQCKNPVVVGKKEMTYAYKDTTGTQCAYLTS